jgi:hypothetical protein
MVKQSVVEYLNRMESIIESSGRLPFSGKRAIDGIELLELIDRIRIALPEEIRQAETLIAENAVSFTVKIACKSELLLKFIYALAAISSAKHGR